MSPLNQRRILLVHPLGYQKEKAAGDVSRIANIMPPIGLVSVAAYLEQHGVEVDLVDCFAHPDSDRLVQDLILAKQPAFVGLSTTTSSFLDGVRLAEKAKQLAPRIRTVFGGPHVSALREKLLEQFPAIDYIVVGEGELALAELLEAAEDPASVEGVVFRDAHGDIGFSGYRRRMAELDLLPFPAYEKLAGFPRAYTLPIFSYPRAPNGTCITSRGCPYACSYCDRSVFRRTFRCNSATYVYEHLSYLRERFGVRHVNIYDDQFTFDRRRVEELTEQLISRPLGITFNCAARAEHIDRELLERMKAAGCWMISLGIESGDEELLTRHRQHADLSLLSQKVREIKAAGIRAKGLFMMGLPGESEASIARTKAYARSLSLDDLNMAKFTPFPGSPLYGSIYDYGQFQEVWEQMDCMNFLFIPHGFTRDRLEDLFEDFYRSHFMRARTVWNYISMIWRSPDSWARFMRHIGGFLRFVKSRHRLKSGTR